MHIVGFGAVSQSRASGAVKHGRRNLDGFSSKSIVSLVETVWPPDVSDSREKEEVRKRDRGAHEHLGPDGEFAQGKVYYC